MMLSWAAFTRDLLHGLSRFTFSSIFPLFSHLSHTFCNFFPASPQTPTLDKCKFSRFEPQIFVLEISISNEYIFFAFVPSLPMTEWWIVNCISITWVCERGIPRSVKGNRRFHKRSWSKTKKKEEKRELSFFAATLERHLNPKSIYYFRFCWFVLLIHHYFSIIKH